MDQQAAKHPELKEFLDTHPEVSVVSRPFYRTHRFKEAPEFDARMHPEREIMITKREGHPTPVSKSEIDKNKTNKTPLFTYAELFAGIGGFGVALEALGGRCVFMSELEDHIRALYCHNLHATNVHGDIYKVNDSEFPENLDLVVGGFPCQPFSVLGDQAGFDCEKGRGQLFLEIIRLMNKSRPKGFLLENVPGLLTMKETFEAIVEAFGKTGYQVTTEVCTARGLTATQRKRLFLVGIRNDIAKSTKEPFEFPYIPDLKLRAENILDYDELPQEELDILRLSDSTFGQLASGRRWRPASMAWPNRTLDTITSHYGNSVGRGESQLVPGCSPHNPRRYSIRECARLMGFPNSYRFLPQREHQGDMAYRKENYRMFGNAVCPPLIAILAGAVLASCDANNQTIDWGRRGQDVAFQLAQSCSRGDPVDLPIGCLIDGS